MGENTPTIDFSNPYYLHPSDNPGQVLVSQQLVCENYTSWSRAMEMALNGKNKVGFIDGSIAEPAGDNAQRNSWIRNNSMVMSWILNSVSKEISASIIFATSAKEIWSDLRDRFQQRNGPRIFQLKRELMNLRQEQQSVSIYFTKMKTIWEELSNYRPNCACAGCNDHYQREYTMSFLMGFEDSFSQIRGQILLMDPMPPINRVFSLIIQEEQQRKTIDLAKPSDNMAFAVKTNTGKLGAMNLQGTRSAGRGNNGSNGNGFKHQRSDKPYCTHCKITGHTFERCYKVHGYPPGYRFKSNNQNQNAANMAVTQVDNKVAQVNVSNPFEDFVKNLNADQYQRFLNMCSSTISSEKANQIDPNVDVNAGYFNQEDDWQG